MYCCEPLIKAIDSYIAKENDDFKDELDEAGFTETSDTIKRINSLEEKLTKALKSQSKYIMEHLKSAVDLKTFSAMLPEIIDGDDVDVIIAEIFIKDFMQNIPKLAESYIKKIDSKLTIDVTTKRTIAWIKGWSINLGNLMKLNTHTDIQQLLIDTLNNGDSIAELTQAIMDSKIRDVRWKARRVAITEVLRSHSVAQQESILQNPAVSQKEWVHSTSYRNTPRENHVDMNGEIVPKNEPFELIGKDGTTYYPMYPRDSNLPPGESVNCHCIHRGIVEEGVLGIPLEERKRLQQEAIDADDGKWEQELDAQNKAKAGILV